MKRKNNTYKISTIFPITWTLCDNCNEEFKFERMWKVVVEYFSFKKDHNIFCRECYSTKNDIIKERVTNGEYKILKSYMNPRPTKFDVK